jgi:hypothetical protein
MPLPVADKVDFGTTPQRTKKAITLRCSTPNTDVREQGLSGLTNKFEQRVIVDIYARDIKAEGIRQGREPADLVAIEKYLVDFLAINRLALKDEGIQYMQVVNSQTFAEIAGGEEKQQVWYHTRVTVILHYWMKVMEEVA